MENELQTTCQKEAMIIATKKSKIHQKQLKYQIIQKLNENNIDDDNIETFLEDFYKYINDIVLIVCHGTFTLKHLLDDPYVKNCFDLNNKDSGYFTYRRNKENKLFNNKYIDDKFRPKYASLNISNNKSGNPCCFGYGKNVIFFNNNIKKISSFVYGNSEAHMFYLCTFDFPNALLFHLDKEITQLKDIIYGKTHNLSKYIEVQIHGNININDCVDKIIIDKTNPNNINYIKEFNIKYPHIQLELV
jgi:hypothetical protein